MYFQKILPIKVVNTLETKIASFGNQLSEIKNIITSQVNTPQANMTRHIEDNSAWFNKEKLAAVKAPPSPSVFVVKKGGNADEYKKHIDTVQKAIMDNNIAMQHTYKNKEDEIVIVCDSKESRDNQKNILQNTDNIATKAPKGIRPTVSIVGLPMEYLKEEVLDMVIKQNGFIKQFSLANNIGEHFKVLVVRPTKNDPSKFQAFVSLSNCLRDVIKQFKDKLTLGLSSCKVYDQYHIKRCNNSQQFGHYYKDCTDIECCAECGGDHPINTCESAKKKYINCVRDGVDTQDHCTYDLKCPSLLKQQELLKQKIAKTISNLKLYREAMIT